MSDKYILRSSAIDAIKRNSGTLYTREAEFLLPKVIFLLKNAPAADVAEVVHGVWAENDDDTIECSCCNAVFDLVCLEPDDFRYCPHCGAKMDGGCER